MSSSRVRRVSFIRRLASRRMAINWERGLMPSGPISMPRIHLRGQSRHADHVELIEVRPHNRQELHPLEERVLLVLRLFQHAALEGQKPSSRFR